jgi:rare lipoprotein A
VSNYRTTRGILAASLLLLGAGVAYAAPGAGLQHLRNGIASWYGPGFEGKRQANGCIFHQAHLSAASRTLPLGSWIRVKRLHSERAVDVEVTDRGPYVGGRVLDLSQAAAEALDMVAVGLVMVSIEPLSARLPVGCRQS